MVDALECEHALGGQGLDALGEVEGQCPPAGDAHHAGQPVGDHDGGHDRVRRAEPAEAPSKPDLAAQRLGRRPVARNDRVHDRRHVRAGREGDFDKSLTRPSRERHGGVLHRLGHALPAVGRDERGGALAQDVLPVDEALVPDDDQGCPPREQRKEEEPGEHRRHHGAVSRYDEIGEQRRGHHQATDADDGDPPAPEVGVDGHRRSRKPLDRGVDDRETEGQCADRGEHGHEPRGRRRAECE